MKPEFVVEMKRLNQVFGNYAPPEAERIFLCVQHLTRRQFARLVSYFIDSAHKPRIPDFKTKVKTLTLDDRKSEATSEDVVKCKFCFGSGVCSVSGSHLPTAVMMNCDCEAGLKSVWNLPIWNEELFPELTKEPLTLTEYIPPKDKDQHEWLDERVDWHTAKITFAKSFWPDYVKEQIGKIDSKPPQKPF